MSRTRHALVIGFVLVLAFAPVAAGPAGASSTVLPVDAALTSGATAAQQTSTVSLVETNVTSGSSFEYELGDYDRVEDFTVELTGAVAREDDVDSGTVTEDGQTLPVSIAGTSEPTGPADGEPELTLTAETQTVSSEYNQGDGVIGLYGQTNSEIRITRPPSTIGEIRTYHSTVGGTGAVVDVYIVRGEGPDATYGEGTLVKEGWEVPNSEGWQTIDVDEYDTNGSTVTVEFVTVERTDSSFGTPVDDRQQDGTTRASWGGNLVSTPFPLEVVSTPPSDVSVTADDGTSVSFGSFSTGESSKSRPVDLSQNATALTVNYSGGDTLEWSLSYTERTESVAPSVSVNGNRLNTSRTLAAGETVSLDPDPSWVREGTNTVRVDLDESSLSDDAPTPVVDMRYTHDVVVEPTAAPESDDSDSDGPSGGGGGGAPAPDDDGDDGDDSIDDDGDGSDDDDSDDGDDSGDGPDDAADDDSNGGGGDGGSVGGAGGGGASSGSGGGGAAESDASEDGADVEAVTASVDTATLTATSDASGTTTPQAADTADGTVVTNVSFEPSRISTNVRAVVVVTVRNPQRVAGTHPVALELDGQPIETREVSVPARSTATVQFAFEFTSSGTYTARVDDETATITVVDPEAGTPTSSTSTRFPGFTPVTVVLAGLVLLVLAGRRRH
ncbi:hypothetical protein [Salinigranum sp.]|uniref:hypothetical protein n=1 Tax=Salinigranum sp. TaxID=1966351 RepID=UPI0035648752